MSVLARMAKKHKANKLSPEEEHYLGLYERYFEPRRSDELRLLEIGVQGGGSLRMWADYFPRAKVDGLDIKEKCKVHGGGRIGVFIASQSNGAFLETLGDYDIIIDDGSHMMGDQKTSFHHLWPHVISGGYYVIEDLHTSYWPEFGGNIANESNTMAYLGRRLHDLNHWGATHKRAPKDRRRSTVDIGLAGMHFHRSICFLEKA